MYYPFMNMSQKKRTISSLPLVSVIIPTRNSIKTIELSLKSIHRQTYRSKEIIVVDQESTDGTIEVAKKYADKVLTAKADKFYSAPPISRNIGAKASYGKYLLHLDSDMEPEPTVLEQGVKIFESNPEILALKIHERDIGEGFWSRAKILERKCYIGYDAIEAARFIRRDVFFKLGGYDESLRSAEDWDMSKRIQQIGQIGVVSSFINHHLGKLKFFNQVKKKFNYGLTLDIFLKKHGFNLEKEFKMVFRIVYLSNIKLFLQDPIGTVGFIILRPAELIAYLSGLLWAKFTKIKV